MQFGEDEPPIIRSGAVYRQTKMEALKKTYGIEKDDRRDQATIVRDMSGDTKYSQIIIDVGANPFHVIFCSPEQVLVYKEYCRVVSLPRTATDASGKFVRKLEKCPGAMTGHLFFYTVTINFENKTIPVYQMLTERQDADWIIYWLRTWLRKFKVRPPKESTSDEERALVLGQCQAFNGMTIKKYVDEVFLWAKVETRRRTLPFPATTVIRLDVAHFVAAAAKWSCLNDSYKFRTKRFYVRVITLMIDCQSVDEFRHIFLLTCIVALIPVNDYIVRTPEFEMTAQEARKQLEDHIAIRGPIIDKLESFIGNNESEIPYNFDPLPEESCSGRKSTVTHQWIKDLISSVKPENPEKIPGDLENPFYLPPFIDDLERVGKEFPLWTGAAIPNGEKHASSAYQEGYFNAVRNGVFQNMTLPCVCHVFLKKLLDDILSGNIYMSKELKKFV
ncbi:uncharacterized protein, partial [Fopius arisanus]|uniref:Uncharacterized protein n=1 Tax=Fopius arisanus TaxID=64838 RepID=A0A9R1TRA4_9HYME